MGLSGLTVGPLPKLLLGLYSDLCLEGGPEEALEDRRTNLQREQGSRREMTP